MIDGESSILPVSERLQRLREYSSDFQRGAFQHQDPTMHPDYVRFQTLNLEWPLQFPISTKCTSGALYRNIYDIDKAILYLSLSVPGSERAGIRPSRSLFTIHTAVEPGLIVTGWAMDDAQDIFIIADVAHMFAYEPMQPRCVYHFMRPINVLRNHPRNIQDKPPRGPHPLLFVKRLEDGHGDSPPCRDTTFHSSTNSRLGYTTKRIPTADLRGLRHLRNTR